MNTPIVITEEYWANSPLSLARYYGRAKYNGHEYIIVNKEGKDIFECSMEAEKEGREKAIEPGDPADLCRDDFVSTYRKFGRDKFLAVLEEHPQATDKELKKFFKEL